MSKSRQIGANIRLYRKKNGLTQAELAKRVGFKSGTPISLLESGQRGLLADVALRICKVLNITIDDLLKGI